MKDLNELVASVSRKLPPFKGEPNLCNFNTLFAFGKLTWPWIEWFRQRHHVDWSFRSLRLQTSTPAQIVNQKEQGFSAKRKMRLQASTLSKNLPPSVFRGMKYWKTWWFQDFYQQTMDCRKIIDQEFVVFMLALDLVPLTQIPFWHFRRNVIRWDSWRSHAQNKFLLPYRCISDREKPAW